MADIKSEWIHSADRHVAGILVTTPNNKVFISDIRSGSNLPDVHWVKFDLRLWPANSKRLILQQTGSLLMSKMAKDDTPAGVTNVAFNVDALLDKHVKRREMLATNVVVQRVLFGGLVLGMVGQRWAKPRMNVNQNKLINRGVWGVALPCLASSVVSLAGPPLQDVAEGRGFQQLAAL